MGCLNSNQGFSHHFGNIHLSGPCNRACYFCIGQHMQALDPINNLDTWPLPGMDEFLAKCKDQNIGEINLTGSDTDPLLYRHIPELTSFLREQIPGVTLGIRTNGVREASRPELLDCFDKASISITSFNPTLYKKTMGKGCPPDLLGLLRRHPNLRVKANIVLAPETVAIDPVWLLGGHGIGDDLLNTFYRLLRFGIKTVNLREPYGQSHIGDPLAGHRLPWVTRVNDIFGMPTYDWDGKMKITYWDVHYVEVESVNLYANGVVSTDYPVTKGHHPTGFVLDQSHFSTGRHHEQWKNKPRLKVIK